MALRRQYADPGQLFTIKQIAEKSGMSEKTIRRAIDDEGKNMLSHIRLGTAIRVSEAQYLDWLRRNTCEGRL